jgi:hypothetical protein
MDFDVTYTLHHVIYMLLYVIYRILIKGGMQIMAPLQKRALYGLVFGIVWATALILVFILKGGAAVFDEDAAFRLLIDGLWVGGLIVYLVLFETIIRTKRFDERDRIIIDRSARVQWLALIFSMVGWIIGLSEHFHQQGQVPVVFLYIMFIFTLLVSTIAQSAGILIGYWRMGRIG